VLPRVQPPGGLRGPFGGEGKRKEKEGKKENGKMMRKYTLTNKFVVTAIGVARGGAVGAPAPPRAEKIFFRP